MTIFGTLNQISNGFLHEFRMSYRTSSIGQITGKNRGLSTDFLELELLSRLETIILTVDFHIIDSFGDF